MDESMTSDVFLTDTEDGFLAAWDWEQGLGKSDTWTGNRLAIGLGSEPTVINRENARVLRDSLTHWLEATR